MSQPRAVAAADALSNPAAPARARVV